MGRPPVRVDVLMGLKGVDFETCWNNRVQGHYGDTPTQFISAGDLIVNKRLAGRPQDLADVENLIISLEDKINRNDE
jgi:hypothetical protein